MEDAKKLPISVRYGEVKSRKKEFLVPHPNEDGTLVGIETGKVYKYKIGNVLSSGLDEAGRLILHKEANRI